MAERSTAVAPATTHVASDSAGRPLRRWSDLSTPATARLPRHLPLDTGQAAARLDRAPEQDRGVGAPSIARREAIARRSLAIADAVAAALALVVALGVVGGHTLQAGLLLALPAIVVVLKMTGLYDRDGLLLHKSTIDEVPALAQHAASYTLVVWLGQDALVGGSVAQAELAVLWVALAVALPGARSLARGVVSRTLSPERCVFIGDEVLGERLAAKLKRSDSVRAEIVATVPLRERRRDRAPLDPPPHADLEEVVQRYVAHRVIVGLDAVDAGASLDVIARAKALGANVTLLPQLLEVVGSSVVFDDVDGVAMLGVRRFGLSRSSRTLKRGIDVVGAALALVATAPLLALIAVAIKLDSRGPVLYRQIRVGQAGRPFTMLKFRSMVDGAHAQREALRRTETSGELFKLPDDPRVTRVGRWLRRSSFDELPQLLNILRGDMSLVGPRPLILEEDRLVEGFHRRRLHLPPGMTGPWQILGSPDARVPLREMVTIDYLYAANWTVWTDITILVRTVAHVLRRRGA